MYKTFYVYKIKNTKGPLSITYYTTIYRRHYNHEIMLYYMSTCPDYKIIINYVCRKIWRQSKYVFKAYNSATKCYKDYLLTVNETHICSHKENHKPNIIKEYDFLRLITWWLFTISYYFIFESRLNNLTIFPIK